MSGLSQKRECAISALLLIGGVSCAEAPFSSDTGDPAPTEEQGSERAGGNEQPVPDPLVVPLSELNCAPTTPVPSEGRLLTRLQYESTILDLFGISADISAFPRENEVLGFRTNAAYHRISPLLAEAQMAEAERVASLVAAQVSTGDCSSETEACGLSYLRELSPRVFRRPLTEAELSPLERLFSDQLPTAGFEGALSLVVEVLLQSPQFLYRLEFAGEALKEAPGFELDSYEAASRLSYFLWNSLPDAELMEAASNSGLVTAEQVEEQARRMLADPKARRTVDDFYAQWLDLDQFESLVREAPGFSEADLAPSWHDSLSAFLSHTFWEPGASFEGLMTSDAVFLDSSLAKLYGTDAPTVGTLEPMPTPDARRSGLLTQPGLLSLLAHSQQSSPILRGVFVREEILCQPPPAPPPNVDQTVPDPEPGATTRERFRVHTESPSCASCHALIDPIGLGFEAYDHLGRFRELENDQPVDTSGEIVAVREKAIEGKFDGALELSARLAKSEQAKLCFVTQWYRYAAGRIEQDADLCSIAQARHTFGPRGDMRELLVGLAMTDAFRFRAEAKLKQEESEL